jgi:hypothetical protein
MCISKDDKVEGRDTNSVENWCSSCNDGYLTSKGANMFLVSLGIGPTTFMDSGTFSGRYWYRG